MGGTLSKFEGAVGMHLEDESTDNFLKLESRHTGEILRMLRVRDASNNCSTEIPVQAVCACLWKKRDAKDAVKSMDADLGISPMMHGSPPKPFSVFETTKDFFNLLLAGVSCGHLLGAPVHAVGE